MRVADEIRDRVAADVIGSYAAVLGGDFKKNGTSEYCWVCPGHDDHDPSLRVNPANRTWYCDVCKVGGDIFDLYALKHGLTCEGSDFLKVRDGLAPLLGVNGTSNNATVNIVATYDYGDEKSELQFQVVRYEPKSFKQRRPDGNGGWIWNLGGVRRVLFRLRELIAAAALTWIFIVEGEKDANKLAALGLVSTTNPGGAGKWREEYNQYFKGRRVAIPPDADDAGRKHATQVAQSLVGVAAEVRIVELPGLPEKGDISDWLDAGHTREELLSLVEKTSLFKPSSDGDIHQSHGGNGADHSSAKDSIDWEPPIPFRELNLPGFPTDALPKCLGNFVEAEAMATQTPPDLPAILVISTVAAACAKKVRVRVKEGYSEPLNLYTVVSLPPGERKSAVFADVAKPIEDFEASEAKRLEPEIATSRTAYQIALAKLEKAKRLAAGGDKQAEQEAKNLAIEVEGMEVSSAPRFIVDDITPEKLVGLVSANSGRMAVMSAEGGVFDMMNGRYSKNGEANLEIYLKGHSGDTVRVDRINRPPEFIKEPALTVALTVQPHVINGLTRNPGFRGRGVLGRFLYALPKSRLGHRDTKPPPVSLEIRQVYADVITALLELPLTKSDERTPELCFEEAALWKMQDFELWVEEQLAEDGQLGSMTDWGGKFFGAVARIAGDLHMAENYKSDEPWKVTISLETAKHAIRIGKYLLLHAKAAYALMGADPQIEDALYLRSWIKKTGLKDFTERDAFNGTRGRFKHVSKMKPALAILVEHGEIRPRPPVDHPGAGRKPAIIFDVNPFSHNTHNPQNPADDPNSADCADCADCAEEGASPKNANGVQT